MRIARGVFRTVLVTRRFVIKAPSLKKTGYGRLCTWCLGYTMNNWERRMTKAEMPNVAPVLWHLGPFNVYPYCAPVMVGNDFDYDALSWVGQNWDRKPENLGIYQDRVVWIDYG